MYILLACEESQAVCTAFRAVGHDAFSCDVLPTSGRHPEWHIQADVLPLLNGRCSFTTADGANHYIGTKWDMIVAFPPCTYLTVTGNKWFKPEYLARFPDRLQMREDAVRFFLAIASADCDRIAIENPVGVMSSRFRKPDQYVQPYWFGHTERKKTGLWLKGLPLLVPTNMVQPRLHTCKSGRLEPAWHMETITLPPFERSLARSKTFPGLAAAMAAQWGGCIG